MRPTLLALTFLLAVMGLAQAGPGDKIPAMEAAILARILPPSFPARDFSITAFGANQAGDCSDALAKAIAACHEAGGGRVVVPPGVWLTGSVRLLSGVNLHIQRGATLKFDPNPPKYLPVVLTRFEGMEIMNYAPLIYAYEQVNIAVTGAGTLDGSASEANWWRWKGKDKTWKGPTQKADRNLLVQQVATGVPVKERVYGDGHYLRPSFIEPQRCQNVLIEGVTVVNAPMWVLHPLLCSNVTVRGVTVRSLGPNNDGCDPESCRDVLIEDCVFETGDDCIAIKSGRNNDGRRVAVPSENIIVRRCTMKDGHGGMTLGSEISGDVRNVFVSACTMDSPNLDRAFRFKSNAVRGGVLENIQIRDVKIGRVAKAVFGVEFDYDEGAQGPHQPILRAVTIERVTSESCGQVVSIGSFPAAVISGIVFRDCIFRGVEKPDTLKDAPAPVFERVSIGISK